MIVNRLLLAALATSVLGRAAHTQEADSYVSGMGKEGFMRFEVLCRDQKAACDAAFRFGTLVGTDAVMRCAPASDRTACFKETISSPAFVEEEREAITGQKEPQR
jgi:hypothetical protein